MTKSNLEQEMVWINAWNDLCDLITLHPDAYILLSDYKVVSEDEAQGWIQDAAYDDYDLEFSMIYFSRRHRLF